MFMKEFCEKYNVKPREVDYWANLGLIRCARKDNGYRIFGYEAEEDIKTIIVAKAMNVSDKLEDTVIGLRCLPKCFWKKYVVPEIEAEIERVTKIHKLALAIAKEEI